MNNKNVVQLFQALVFQICVQTPLPVTQFP